MHKLNYDKSRAIIKKIIKEKFGSQKNFCKLKNEHAGTLSTLLKGEHPIRKLSPTKIIELEEKLEVPLGSILFPEDDV